MNTSRYIARLIGPLFLVMGLGMVIEGDIVRVLSQEFLSNLSLIYLAGMLTLVAGLAIVNAHNLWVADWRIIITILGWLSVIGGVIRVLFPGKVQALGTGMLSHPHAMIIAGIVVLVLGAILCWTGYELLGQAEPKPKPKPAARPKASRAAAKPKTSSAAARPKTSRAAAKPRSRATASRSAAKRTTRPSRSAAKRAKPARKPRSTARKRKRR